MILPYQRLLHHTIARKPRQLRWEGLVHSLTVSLTAGVPERALWYLNPRETMQEIGTKDTKNIARFLAGSNAIAKLAYIIPLTIG